MEKPQKELPNPLPGENQPTICLICDQTLESKKHCLEHIQIVHGLQNMIENYHYKIKSHSKENSINSINPAPPVKLDEQGSKDGTTKPKPKVATNTKTQRPSTGAFMRFIIVVLLLCAYWRTQSAKRLLNKEAMYMSLQ